MEFYPKSSKQQQKGILEQGTQMNIKNRQIQNLEQIKIVPFAGNLQQNISFKGKNVYAREKQKQESNLLLRLKIVFGCLTTFQFSMVVALIVLLFITSQIKLSSLTLAILLAALLYSILLALCCNLQNTAVEAPLDTHPKLPFSYEAEQDYQVPTVLKINQEGFTRDNSKTKKIQFQSNKVASRRQDTEKNIKMRHSSIFCKKSDFKSVLIRKILFIVLKSLQMVFDLVFASLSIFVFNKENQLSWNGVLWLSIIIYLLAIISFVTFVTLIRSIQARVIPTHETAANSKKIKLSVIQQQLNNSIIQQGKAQIRKKAPSIDLNIKPKQIEKHITQEKTKQEHIKYIQMATKSQLKKSVLKLSKGVKKQQGEQVIERRKAQINSKKIQRFEYENISPSGFGRNLKNRFPKNSSRKLASMQKKEEIYESILKRKALARGAQAKSSRYMEKIKQEGVVKQMQSISISH